MDKGQRLTTKTCQSFHEQHNNKQLVVQYYWQNGLPKSPHSRSTNNFGFISFLANKQYFTYYL